jgi:undecaprenyl diphosphate synthase
MHIAIIMDGNRRWAKNNGLSIKEGYKKGMEVAKEIIKLCPKNNITHLTLFAFSSENWNRPKEQVDEIFSLLVQGIDANLEEFTSKGIKIDFIGDFSKMDKKSIQKITQAKEAAVKEIKLNLIVALSYGGRQEILQAVQKSHIATEEEFTKNLYTANYPDPDLLIRTGGQYRISNFLLWQIAYTELLFLEKNWPDFNAQDFTNAILEYKKRERRFGD